MDEDRYYGCKCQTCIKEFIFTLNTNYVKYFRYACERCGNKRCPHHANHIFKYINSNDLDQIGEIEC